MPGSLFKAGNGRDTSCNALTNRHKDFYVLGKEKVQPGAEFDEPQFIPLPGGLSLPGIIPDPAGHVTGYLPDQDGAEGCFQAHCMARENAGSVSAVPAAMRPYRLVVSHAVFPIGGMERTPKRGSTGVRICAW